MGISGISFPGTEERKKINAIHRMTGDQNSAMVFNNPPRDFIEFYTAPLYSWRLVSGSPREDRIGRNDHQEYPERFFQYKIRKPFGYIGADQSADKKPYADKRGDIKTDMAAVIIPHYREKPYREQHNGQGRPLRFMLRQSCQEDQGGDKYRAAPYPE